MGDKVEELVIASLRLVQLKMEYQLRPSEKGDKLGKTMDPSFHKSFVFIFIK